jgi:hypothetical protein
MVKKFTVEVAVGDKIEIGRFRNVHATIEDIEFDKWGHPCLNLGKHKKMLFNCRLLKLIPKDVKRNNPLTPVDEKDLNK